MKRAIYRIIDSALKTLLRKLPVSATSEYIALWWGYRYRPKPTCVKLRSGALIQTNLVDHLQLLLYYTGTFEPSALDVMRDHLRSGDTLLDVGANIGLFSIEGAHVGARVIAIEAAPQHAAIVEASSKLNGSDIQINSCAVGDVPGTATLTLPRSGNGGMFTLGNVEGSEKITVPVRTIDDIVGDRQIDFIKMDIEGSEYRALVGAAKTISRCAPPILIELNDAALLNCGTSSRQVKQFLFDHGYRGQIIGSQRQIELGDAHQCDECLFQVL